MASPTTTVVAAVVPIRKVNIRTAAVHPNSYFPCVRAVRTKPNDHFFLFREQFEMMQLGAGRYIVGVKDAAQCLELRNKCQKVPLERMKTFRFLSNL